ncbi:hypothetical protein GF361_02845 [Candidatus Woesearchaeota archaeon]|nr:hypothetical protein [Candidatus Woesearchaeota archaeon]
MNHTKRNVKKLMNLDSIIKERLNDEITVMKELYLELMEGLKRVRDSISQADLSGSDEKNLESIKNTIGGFIDELAPLEQLDERFKDIKKHSIDLKNKLKTLRDSLNVYGTTKKALIDFDNNILYEFKTTIQRDFKEDIDYNKRIEKMLI